MLQSLAEREFAMRDSCNKKFQRRILVLSVNTNHNLLFTLIVTERIFSSLPFHFQECDSCLIQSKFRMQLLRKKSNHETSLSRNFIHCKTDFQACARHEGPTVSHSSALSPESSETNKCSYSVPWRWWQSSAPSSGQKKNPSQIP